MKDTGEMILAEGVSYSLNDIETRLNNNLLVVGASGTGKTRGVVTPALLRPSGSYLISDPKGNLYTQYKLWLEKNGYDVRKLDFTNPCLSDRWDPMTYIRTESDAFKMAHAIISAGESSKGHPDPFWYESGEMLLTALILFLKERREKEAEIKEDLLLEKETFSTKSPEMEEFTIANTVDEDENKKKYRAAFSSLLLLLRAGRRVSDGCSGQNVLDTLFSQLSYNSSARKIYDSVACSPNRTWDSILITICAKLRAIDTNDMKRLFSFDDLDIASLGTKKKAVFVVVSDTDRSMDFLANIFFSMAMQELARTADLRGGRLSVPVRFILDDFATNCKIAEFPRLISSIRSRGISATLIIQSFAQLEYGYDAEWKTITANCDTMLYLGGNDIETADNIARRLDLPMREILYMPVGDVWIFRRGAEPHYGTVINPDNMPEMDELKRMKEVSLRQRRERREIRLNRMAERAREEESVPDNEGNTLRESFCTFRIG